MRGLRLCSIVVVLSAIDFVASVSAVDFAITERAHRKLETPAVKLFDTGCCDGLALLAVFVFTEAAGVLALAYTDGCSIRQKRAETVKTARFLAELLWPLAAGEIGFSHRSSISSGSKKNSRRRSGSTDEKHM